jgi:hypothetical protein
MAGLLTALFVVALASNAGFVRRLRTHHRETWEQLGSPSLTFGPTPRASLWKSRVLSRGEYRRLQDRVLDRWAMAERLSAGIFLAAFLVIVFAKWTGQVD